MLPMTAKLLLMMAMLVIRSKAAPAPQTDFTIDSYETDPQIVPDESDYTEYTGYTAVRDDIPVPGYSDPPIIVKKRSSGDIHHSSTSDSGPGDSLVNVTETDSTDHDGDITESNESDSLIIVEESNTKALPGEESELDDSLVIIEESSSPALVINPEKPDYTVIAISPLEPEDQFEELNTTDINGDHEESRQVSPEEVEEQSYEYFATDSPGYYPIVPEEEYEKKDSTEGETHHYEDDSNNNGWDLDIVEYSA